MPIYEYECLECSERFEALVYGEEKAACPECGSTDLEKLFSSFGVGHGMPSAPPGCGMPQGGG